MWATLMVLMVERRSMLCVCVSVGAGVAVVVNILIFFITSSFL